MGHASAAEEWTAIGRRESGPTGRAEDNTTPAPAPFLHSPPSRPAKLVSPSFFCSAEAEWTTSLMRLYYRADSHCTSTCRRLQCRSRGQTSPARHSFPVVSQIDALSSTPSSLPAHAATPNNTTLPYAAYSAGSILSLSRPSLRCTPTLHNHGPPTQSCRSAS